MMILRKLFYAWRLLPWSYFRLLITKNDSRLDELIRTNRNYGVVMHAHCYICCIIDVLKRTDSLLILIRFGFNVGPQTSWLSNMTFDLHKWKCMKKKKLYIHPHHLYSQTLLLSYENPQKLLRFPPISCFYFGTWFCNMIFNR